MSCFANQQGPSRRAVLGLIGGTLAAAGQSKAALSIEARPLTIIVPFPPGGVTDTLARTLAERLSGQLGTPVIVDNRSGAAAQLAVSALKQSPSDGTALFLGDIGAFVLNPSLYPKLTYDPATDLLPLARIALAPTMLVVQASSPYKTADDLVAAARSEPNGISVASQGNGTIGHLFAHMLQTHSKGKVLHVPYRGSTPALQDLMAGQVQALLDPVTTSGPFVKSGKLRALAVTLPERAPQFPDVPTFAEAGLRDISLVPWFGVAAKSGTSKEATAALLDQL
ncbi:MAG: tripartite tricarboxylate transporter substrate binding protein, partial [Variovorax sp.]